MSAALTVAQIVITPGAALRTVLGRAAGCGSPVHLARNGAPNSTHNEPAPAASPSAWGVVTVTGNAQPLREIGAELPISQEAERTVEKAKVGRDAAHGTTTERDSAS